MAQRLLRSHPETGAPMCPAAITVRARHSTIVEEEQRRARVRNSRRHCCQSTVLRRHSHSHRPLMAPVPLPAVAAAPSATNPA